jgi:rare lipoprotein A
MKDMIRLATTIVCRHFYGRCGLLILTISFIFHFSFFSFYFSVHQVMAQPRQTGMASFYAKRATGSRTASGERLHHDSMTCAHRTHPFGTLLKVTNLDNNKQVVVRVNDRGPFVRGRIIDLSWGAANEIGMIGKGIAKVNVELADGITIPLLPPTETIIFPKVEIDSIELANSLHPIWQEDLLIDHTKVQQHMKNTSRKVIQHRINQLFQKH